MIRRQFKADQVARRGDQIGIVIIDAVIQMIESGLGSTAEFEEVGFVLEPQLPEDPHRLARRDRILLKGNVLFHKFLHPVFDLRDRFLVDLPPLQAAVHAV